MSRHLALSDYIFWVINPILRVIILCYLVRYRIADRLLSFRIYLAFVTVADVYMYFIARFFSVTAYWHSYWITVSIFYMLQLSVAVKIMNLCVSGKPIMKSFVSWAAYIMLTVLMIHTLGTVWQYHWTPVAIWADFLCWFILLISIIFVQNWSFPYKGLAEGLGASMVLHIVAVALQGSQQPSRGIRIVYQIAYTVGLLIWLNTVRNTSRLKAMRAAN